MRETPWAFFETLNAKHNFTIDACAIESNTKCALWYSPVGLYTKISDSGLVGLIRGNVDGLTGRFDQQRVWCNPPFSAFDQWLPWAWRNSAAESITMIAPATRTDRPWWQKWVEPYRDDQPERRGDVHTPRGMAPQADNWRLKTDFPPGRVDFLEDGHPIYRKDKTGAVMLNPSGKNTGKPIESTAMFGLCVLHWSHI